MKVINKIALKLGSKIFIEDSVDWIENFNDRGLCLRIIASLFRSWCVEGFLSFVKVGWFEFVTVGWVGFGELKLMIFLLNELEDVVDQLFLCLDFFYIIQRQNIWVLVHLHLFLNLLIALGSYSYFVHPLTFLLDILNFLNRVLQVFPTLKCDW